jgi:hypothetical protein
MLWIGIVLMPIWIRLSILMSIQIRIWILSQVLHMLENLRKNLTFIHTSVSLHCLYLIFVVGVIGVIIFNILYSNCNFLEESIVNLLFVDLDPDRLV